jgi:hypothetical protein
MAVLKQGLQDKHVMTAATLRVLRDKPKLVDCDKQFVLGDISKIS